MPTTSKVDTIADALKERILSGEFGKDGRLPSFRKLASEYTTTQETMNKTMQALQAEGVLISMGVKGIFVNTQRVRIPGLVAHFSKHLEDSGLKPKEETLKTPEFITPPSEIAKAMLLPKNAQVLLRRRLQGTTAVPLRLVEGYYPAAFITPDMLTKIHNDPHFHIVNAIKKNSGKSILLVHEDVIARLPTAYEQKQLQIVRTNPVLETRLINYTKDKKTVIMYLRMILNANHFLLSFDYEVNHWA